MAWPINSKLAIVLVVLTAFSLGVTPTRIINRFFFLLYHTPALIFPKIPPPAPHTLKAAILNVTADFNELTHLIQDFLSLPGVDPAVEAQFRQFLAARAMRSHPALENALDWILAIYKFAFPFFLISLLAKLSSGGGGGLPGNYPEDYRRVGSLQLAPGMKLNNKNLARLRKQHSMCPSDSPGTPQDGDGGRRTSTLLVEEIHSQ